MLTMVVLTKPPGVDGGGGRHKTLFFAGVPDGVRVWAERCGGAPQRGFPHKRRL